MIGGPAELANESDWTFVAYPHPESWHAELAQKLLRGRRPAAGRAVEGSAFRDDGRYMKIRAGARLFLVKQDPVPYLAAWCLATLPEGVTQERAFADLVRLAQFAIKS